MIWRPFNIYCADPTSSAYAGCYKPSYSKLAKSCWWPDIQAIHVSWRKIRSNPNNWHFKPSYTTRNFCFARLGLPTSFQHGLSGRLTQRRHTLTRLSSRHNLLPRCSVRLTWRYRIPLPKEVPMAFRALPEYILEDIVDHLYFVVQ